jgi:hypothetical protein
MNIRISQLWLRETGREGFGEALAPALKGCATAVDHAGIRKKLTERARCPSTALPRLRQLESCSPLRVPSRPSLEADHGHFITLPLRAGFTEAEVGSLLVGITQFQADAVR